MKYLVVDISTSAQEDIEDSPYLSWACKKGASSPEEAYSKAGLHAEFGMICCISVFSVRFEGSEYKVNEIFTRTALNREAEEELLLAFSNLLSEKLPMIVLKPDHEDTMLAGHNMKNFVIPFLVKRYLGNGLRIPNVLNSIMRSGHYVDLMHELSCGGESKMSLRSAAWLMGVDDPRSSVSNPGFYQLVKEGRPFDIMMYASMNAKVAADVLANCVLGGLIQTEETHDIRRVEEKG